MLLSCYMCFSRMLWLISMQKWVWGLIRPKINIAQSLRFTSYFDVQLGNRRILCQELLNRLELLEFELIFTTLRTLKFWIFAPTNKYLTGWSGQKRERTPEPRFKSKEKYAQDSSIHTNYIVLPQLYTTGSLGILLGSGKTWASPSPTYLLPQIQLILNNSSITGSAG